MSLTFQQIICDAKKLVERLSDHENTANNLITDIQVVCNEIDNMKQYQEELDILNAEAKQKPREQLIVSIQQETRHLREVQAENKELRNALEDYQNVLELIMSKYRQQTSALMKSCKTDFSSLYNSRYANIIIRQANKIKEMTSVMRVATSLGEENELKCRENYTKLKKENDMLREILKISKQYAAVNSESLKNENIDNSPAILKDSMALDNDSELKYKDNDSENEDKNNIMPNNSTIKRKCRMGD